MSRQPVWLSAVPVEDSFNDEHVARHKRVVEMLNVLEDYELDLKDNQLNFYTESRARVEAQGVAAVFTSKQYYWLVGLCKKFTDEEFGGYDD